MNTQPPTNARREAVRKSGSLARVQSSDNAGAPVSALEQDPCGFGVPRSALAMWGEVDAAGTPSR